MLLGVGGGLDQLPWRKIDSDGGITMADSDIIERLEKQIEGSNLALAAVAEVLHKMDSRLTKAEEEELELAEDEQAEVEKAQIIKAVANEVFGLMKNDNPTDAQWGNPGETKASSMSGTGQADDAENAVTIDSKTENVQNTIQAMMKQIDALRKATEEEEEEETEEEGEVENGYGYGMKKENGDDDKPKEDDEEEEEGEGFPEVLQEMQKQLVGLQKSMQIKKSVKKSTSNVDVQKMVEKETERRLRKMGFSEENGLNRPQLIRYDETFGVDGTTPISKSATSVEDAVDQMMNMSYSELRRLQEAVESGETEGIPREFLR